MNSTRQPKHLMLARLTGALLIFAALAASANTMPPSHLLWATDIALNVRPEHNDYASQPSYIQWPDANGNGDYINHTLCASFVTRVLQQAYGWDDAYFRSWTGSTSPNAAHYHDLIMQENGFNAFDQVGEIQPGDLLAIKYPPGSSYTGHLMLVMSAAILRNATAPAVSNTYQYEVKVIDSSATGHGPIDTRKQTDGSYVAGAGTGIFRIYADADGFITGYTWSTYSNSIYYAQSARHLTIGRLLP